MLTGNPDTYVLPATLGATVLATAAALVASKMQMSPQAALYCEKAGGFQCGTCTHSTAINATHGRCEIVAITVHLVEGCCIAWAPDEAQLHLYREKLAS